MSTSETLDSVLPVVPITDAVKAVGGVLNTAAEKMDLPDVQGSKEVREICTRKYTRDFSKISIHPTFVSIFLSISVLCTKGLYHFLEIEFCVQVLMELAVRIEHQNLPCHW